MAVQTIFISGLVAFLFFAIRHMIEEQKREVDKTMVNVKDKIKANETSCNILKEIYLRKDSHLEICAKTQAEFMLHVSKVAEANRQMMAELSNKNLKVMLEEIKSLRSDLKLNEALK